MNANPQLSIRRVLTGNAIFSGASGLLLALNSKAIASFLGVSSFNAILGVGIVALAYAILLALRLSHPVLRPGFILVTVIGDSTWVLLSILLLVTGWVPFHEGGKWVVGIAAALVDVFATLQFIEWRKMA